ncbi:hypothetical protein JR316_0006770 [Psilocybe cubensis]|uniref:Uncharacterized protein n=1 Tax=Psilocybe cubensis TaxID=181762 RepID=A0ACB8GXK5_PSICU|nr:hypothetical protein JR316_0006770 [Psilocybe cubensis]KAH9480172.1 hypothetical protein JR316_0006770 [Psilocybe cubensis]
MKCPRMNSALPYKVRHISKDLIVVDDTEISVRIVKNDDSVSWHPSQTCRQHRYSEKGRVYENLQKCNDWQINVRDNAA